MLPQKPWKEVEANEAIRWDFRTMGSYRGLSGLCGVRSEGRGAVSFLPLAAPFLCSSELIKSCFKEGKADAGTELFNSVLYDLFQPQTPKPQLWLVSSEVRLYPCPPREKDIETRMLQPTCLFQMSAWYSKTWTE